MVETHVYWPELEDFDWVFLGIERLTFILILNQITDNEKAPGVTRCWWEKMSKTEAGIEYIVKFFMTAIFNKDTYGISQQDLKELYERYNEYVQICQMRYIFQ